MVRFGTGELSRVAGVEEARFLRGFRRAFNESHPDPAFEERSRRTKSSRVAELGKRGSGTARKVRVFY